MIGKPFSGDGEQPDQKSKEIGKTEPDTGIKIGEQYRNAEQRQQKRLSLKEPEEEEILVP